jgi:hypothetical protein
LINISKLYINKTLQIKLKHSIRNCSLRFQEVFKGKNNDEEFSQYKNGVSHYHSGAKAQSEMIDYTFLLPCKNDLCKP